jgi:hypothetical protein
MIFVLCSLLSTVTGYLLVPLLIPHRCILYSCQPHYGTGSGSDRTQLDEEQMQVELIAKVTSGKRCDRESFTDGSRYLSAVAIAPGSVVVLRLHLRPITEPGAVATALN